MDTLTHALSGALLARALVASLPASSPAGAGASRAPARIAGSLDGMPVRHAVVLGAVAGAFPDIDALLQLAGDVAYLRGHRGPTHSLLLLPLWAWLLGLAAARLGGASRRWPYCAVAGAAVGIHILGDWITGFGTMLLSPLSDRRFGLGSVFIIDLVLSGILVAGLLASAALRRSRVPALLALAALPVYVGLTVVGRDEALAFARGWADANGIAAVEVRAAPRPASPFNWTVMVSDGRHWHVAHVNPRRTEPLQASADDHFVRRFSAPYLPPALAPFTRYADPRGLPAQEPAAEAWRQPQLAFFRWFAEAPFVVPGDGAPASAGAATGSRGAGSCAVFGDLRFQFPGRTRLPFQFGICGEADDRAVFAFGEHGRTPVR